MIFSHLRLVYSFLIHSIETGRAPRVKTAAHLMRRLCYENKDQLLAGVIIGGWDPVDGGSVYNIPLGGSCLQVPFALSGSGSTYIWGLVDAEFQADMSVEQGRALVKKAISVKMVRASVNLDRFLREYMM